MNDSVTPKKLWDQSVNYTKKLRKILAIYLGFDLKTQAFMVLLIYWAIILLAPFSH